MPEASNNRIDSSMAHDTAFLGANTVLGQYWTKRRYFDYLINKDNFQLTFGRSFRMMVYLDNAIANGQENVRKDVEADTRATNYLMNHLRSRQLHHHRFPAFHFPDFHLPV